MTSAARRRLLSVGTAHLLAVLIPFGGDAQATTPEHPPPPPVLVQDALPPVLVQDALPPVPVRGARSAMLVRDALAAMPNLHLAGQMPLPGGLTLHLAVPAGDLCSPQAVWLLCPGLRLASRGTGAEALVMAAWHTSLPEAPMSLAALRQAARERHGPPTVEERTIETRWGLNLVQHRMRWTMAGLNAPLHLEAVFVLDDAGAAEDAEATEPAPNVQRIGWSATLASAAAE